MATQKTQRVRVVRAFYQKGEPVGPGSVLDLPAPQAFELKSANKVVFVQADTKLTKNSEIPAPADATPPADKSAAKGAGKEGAK
jgi:hypothetical protein